MQIDSTLNKLTEVLYLLVPVSFLVVNLCDISDLERIIEHDAATRVY